jgi:hypothetical protein
MRSPLSSLAAVDARAEIERIGLEHAARYAGFEVTADVDAADVILRATTDVCAVSRVTNVDLASGRAVVTITRTLDTQAWSRLRLLINAALEF